MKHAILIGSGVSEVNKAREGQLGWSVKGELASEKFSQHGWQEVRRLESRGKEINTDTEKTYWIIALIAWNF